MQNIVIFSNNQPLIKLWSHALISHFDLSTASQTNDFNGAAVVIIDSKLIDEDDSLTLLFANKTSRFLVIGQDWPESKQINALVHGAAGYCGECEPAKLLLQAISSVLKGDVWIQRHLVPQVIGTLVKMKADPLQEKKASDSIESVALLKSLSARERDVANMIREGENNKTIASKLGISERTVKAHLTSTFKKLNVNDRLHLALYIKEYS